MQHPVAAMLLAPVTLLVGLIGVMLHARTVLLDGVGQRLHPPGEGGRERPRLDAVEDPLERVVTRNALGELEEPPQPVLPLPGEGSDWWPIIGAADDGANGDTTDVEHHVAWGTAG